MIAMSSGSDSIISDKVWVWKWDPFAQFLELTVVLHADNWSVECNNHQKIDVNDYLQGSDVGIVVKLAF